MIETTKYHFNKTLHIEMGDTANRIASSKNVQVSRWVNNSNRRQIVTYIVHTGERANRAVDQQNVLFQVSEDAGRNNYVTDETAMLNAVVEYLNSIVVDEPEYEIADQILGDGSGSFTYIANFVSEFIAYEGWVLRTEESGDQIRIYAERDGSEDLAPSLYSNWIMITPDWGYLVIADRIQAQAV